MHSLRAHYFIDLFSEIFIGHYIFITVEIFVDYNDKTPSFNAKGEVVQFCGPKNKDNKIK